jgi:hypothetical protein
MPLSLRFVVPLALALAAIAYAVVPLVDRPRSNGSCATSTRAARRSPRPGEPLAELIADNRTRR